MVTKKTETKAKPKAEKKPVKTVKTTAKKKSFDSAQDKKSAKVPAAPLPGKRSSRPVAAPSEEKIDVISQFATKEGDTGSPEVQIALLTKRIEKLVGHLKGNPQDNHSRRGLLGMVSKRRRLLNYLSDKDENRAKEVMGKLKLN